MKFSTRRLRIAMLGKLALPEIQELLATGDDETLTEVLNRWLPADLAELATELPTSEFGQLLRVIDPQLAAETFGHLELSQQIRLLDGTSRVEAAFILNEMAPDDRTTLLAELSESESQRLLALLTSEQRAIAESLLTHDANSVGRLMTPDYIAVRREWTVLQVLNHIRHHGKDSETLNVIYVIDDDNRLVDDLRIREILLAPLHSLISELCDSQSVSLSVNDDHQTAVAAFRKYGRVALPVVDDRGCLAGIVTLDDVLDVAEEEATRELQQFGGLEALDEPYMNTPLTLMIRKRATWLVILFLGEMLTATAMGFYEDEIQRAVVLALFVPLIISSGGNSGSQAATLIIRALALGEVKMRDWGLVLRRELLSGLLLGLLLGSIGFLRIALWSSVSSIYGEHWVLVGITVGLALLGIVLWGTLMGSMLPFLLKKLGADPATSSAPFVATLVDVTGLIIYFNVAWLILRGTLL